MARIEMIVLQLALVAATASCANRSGSSPASEGEAQTVVPCAVPAARSDSVMWREVRGEGFTFCVPADWRPSGPNTWRGGGGIVTWGRSATARIPITVGRMDSDNPVTAGRAPVPPSDGWEATERIGGESVRLRSMRMGAKYSTFAEWSSRLLHFSGTAASAREAERQLEIYRTVRTR